ncbi:MAG TPA: alpha/beta fold hydrolase [Acidobacteriaceae bacterium]
MNIDGAVSGRAVEPRIEMEKCVEAIGWESMAKGKASQTKSKPAERAGREPLRGASAFEKALHEMRHQEPGAYEDVSAKWLLKALAISLAGIALLAWAAYCWVFWQGSWQLLYHPTEAIKRTPASVGLAYEPVRFGPDASGTARLTGWWIPAEGARWTALYLHGADGNLGDTVDALSMLHRERVAIFAIDYRGYGQSAKARPSEAGWMEDAGAALDYLTATRHLAPAGIVVYGQGLGANLAAEFAAMHASVAGVVLDRPATEGAGPIFADARSRIVPARWLVSDRWELTVAARAIRQPSLWLEDQLAPERSAAPSGAYAAVEGRKTLVWLNPPIFSDPHLSEELKRWLDDLATR